MLSPHFPVNIDSELQWVPDPTNKRRLYLSMKAKNRGYESVTFAVFGQISGAKCSIYGNCSVDYHENVVDDMDVSQLLKSKMTWYLQVSQITQGLKKGTA